MRAGGGGQVSLVGHSAGAQLAMMALLHRTKRSGLQNGRRQQQQQQQRQGQQDSIPSLLYPMDAWRQDARMPKRLVGERTSCSVACHVMCLPCCPCLRTCRGTASVSTCSAACITLCIATATLCATRRHGGRV